MNHVELGKAGEKLAIELLRNKKHEILSTNYRFGRNEIDIISQCENEIVFTEVKTRNSLFFGSPAEAVSRPKQRQIINVANQYIQKEDVNLEVRFDVIGIILNSNQKEIEHIENAFTPSA